MKVECMIIRSATRSWESMCQEAAVFASGIGRERLINISVSASGDNLGANGTIFVWYWDDETPEIEAS